MRSVLAITAGLIAMTACSEYNLAKPDEEPELAPTVPEPGVPVPDIEVDVAVLDFGAYPATCLTEDTFTIRNVGDADLLVSDVLLTDGSSFGVSTIGPITIAPGDASPVTVQFTPHVEALFAEGIHIHSNDPDEPMVEVGLDGEGTGAGEIVEAFDQLGSALPVDILFVVDNSTSMGDENLALQNNFNQFIQGFLTLGLDYQIGVVTTDMQTPGYQGLIQGPIISSATANPVQQFNQNTDIPFTDVMEEQGLDAVSAALSPAMLSGPHAGLVRPGSLLSVIVISDEDDQSVISTNDMISFLDGFQGDPDLTSLSIVGGPTSGIWPCGGFLFGAAPVPRYWDVAQATGGIHLNLCQLDMNEIVQQLAVVAAGLSTEFPLTNVPADPTAIRVTVDGQLVPNDPDNGWVYDANNNSVAFIGGGVPPAGSVVEVAIPTASTCP